MPAVPIVIVVIVPATILFRDDAHCALARIAHQEAAPLPDRLSLGVDEQDLAADEPDGLVRGAVRQLELSGELRRGVNALCVFVHTAPEFSYRGGKNKKSSEALPLPSPNASSAHHLREEGDEHRYRYSSFNCVCSVRYRT